MTTFDALVQDYVVDHHDKIRKLTEPLHRYLGSTYFTYHRINDHGDYYALVDRPDWAEHYGGNAFYQIDPYLCHPENYTNSVALWTTRMQDPDTQVIVSDAREVFHMDHGMMVIRKGENEVEMFGFGAPARKAGMIDVYVSNISLLHSFCDYFKRECADLIENLERNPVDLITIKGERFQGTAPQKASQQLLRRDQFLESIGLGDLVAGAKQLTTREKQSLRLLCQGYSAPASSSAMNLSPRTVEHYLENVKNKLTCFSREELLDLGRQMLQLGLLD